MVQKRNGVCKIASAAKKKGERNKMWGYIFFEKGPLLRFQTEAPKKRESIREKWSTKTLTIDGVTQNVT